MSRDNRKSGSINTNETNEIFKTIISTIPEIVEKIKNSTMTINDIKTEMNKVTELSFSSKPNNKKIISEISNTYNTYVKTIEKIKTIDTTIFNYNNNDNYNKKTTNANNTLIKHLEEIYNKNKYMGLPPPSPSPPSPPSPPQGRSIFNNIADNPQSRLIKMSNSLKSSKRHNFLNNIAGNPQSKLRKRSTIKGTRKNNKGLNLSLIRTGPGALLKSTQHSTTQSNSKPKMSELETILAKRREKEMSNAK